jgi:6-phosphogluconolactonase (cycloisomerase 2 family)
MKICPIVILLVCLSACVGQKDSSLYLLVGTYTSGSSAGIYVYRFDTETGVSEYVSEHPASNPSYLTLSADERFVYAIGENSAPEAIAAAYAFDKATGVLTLLNEQPTKGAGPCYINTNREGTFVVTANYGGGSVSVFPIANDGQLQPASGVFAFEGTGPDEARQQRPHLHCVVFTPDLQYLFAEDLGSDQLHKFAVHSEPPFLSVGSPDAFQVAPGSGPRHLAFHPNGKYAYLNNELSGTVTAFQYADGDLQAIQYIASDTTAGAGSKGGADIHVSPDGKFLYASNRLKSDGISIFRISETTGMLTAAGYQLTGIHPRNFIITPNGKFLLAANRDSNSIQVFSIHPQTGLLTDTGNTITEIDKPVCLKFARL